MGILDEKIIVRRINRLAERLAQIIKIKADEENYIESHKNKHEPCKDPDRWNKEINDILFYLGEDGYVLDYLKAKFRKDRTTIITYEELQELLDYSPSNFKQWLKNEDNAIDITKINIK